MIDLVHHSNGNIAAPSALGASHEYYLTTIMGNRGKKDGGAVYQ
jgi:hypothetical protein